jgi:hypothetical protein
MHITADNYEICFDIEQPGVLRILDTTTQSTREFTLEEAVTILKLMITHHEEIGMLKAGA